MTSRGELCPPDTLSTFLVDSISLMNNPYPSSIFSTISLTAGFNDSVTLGKFYVFVFIDKLLAVE